MESEKSFSIKACAVGMLFAGVLFAVLSLIGAIVFKMTPIGENVVKPVSYLLLGVSCLTGGIISSKVTGKRGAVNGITTGVMFALLLLVIELVVTGAFSSPDRMMVPGIVILSASLFGGIIGVN